MSSKIYITGNRFTLDEAENAYKRGLCCLRCGKFVGSTMCENCAKYDKCGMCGIVCVPNDIRVSYSYPKSVNRKYIVEQYTIVKPICNELVNGLCEDCKDYKKRVKNVCFLCNSKFPNTLKNYVNNGNMCESCRISATSTSSKMLLRSLEVRHDKDELSTLSALTF